MVGIDGIRRFAVLVGSVKQTTIFGIFQQEFGDFPRAITQRYVQAGVIFLKTTRRSIRKHVRMLVSSQSRIITFAGDNMRIYIHF